MKCLLRHGFCGLDSRKCLCKSHPHEKEGNMKGISVKIHHMEFLGSQPDSATPYPPVHPPTSFPDLRRVTVTNLGFIFNTCKSWLRDLPLFSPNATLPLTHPNTLSQRFPNYATEKAWVVEGERISLHPYCKGLKCLFSDVLVGNLSSNSDNALENTPNRLLINTLKPRSV